MNKSYVGFWKEWKRLSQVQCPPVNRIANSIAESDITKTFKSYFCQIYSNNSTKAHDTLRTEFEERFSRYLVMHQKDSISSPFLSWADMVTVVGKLKTGKSSNSFLKAEHILNGSPKLITHIHLL